MRKEYSTGLGWSKLAGVALAMNMAITQPETSSAKGTRDDVANTLKMGDESGVENQPLPVIDAAKEFKVPNELIIEGEGLKATMIEITKDYSGLKFMGKLEGNGGRDVLIYVPEGFDPTKPVELVYHFHGTNGNLIDEIYPPLEGASAGYNRHVQAQEIGIGGNRLRQVLSEAQEGQQEGRNYIVVYPISEAQRGPKGFDENGRAKSAAIRNGYDAFWMRKGNSTKDNMFTLDEEVKETLATKMHLPQLNLRKTTIKGHSAGGEALMNVALSGFPVDRIDFLDASYGWAGPAYRAAMKTNPNTEMNVFTRMGTATAESSLSLKGKEGVEIIAIENNPKAKIPKSEKGFKVIVDQNLQHAVMNENFFNYQRPEEKVAERNSLENN